MSTPLLRSVHTTSVPALLADSGLSLLVTTYQAEKLVILRNDAGVLNTHFRAIRRPMGLAVDSGRLAVGCATEVCEFHDVPAVCKKLDASEDYPTQQANHDACFLPRWSSCTGDVQIHELAWADSGPGERDLVFVNTAFSCLAVRSANYSFEPIWRPPFISKLAPGDNCHLNGLAIRDGRVRYVTALGTTDTPAGWRENKRDGGVLLDVATNQVIAAGLCMPHSPRWYRGKLWVLESGDGTLGTVALDTGEYHAVAQLPGFTRGLSFWGPFAFVGLSQVRESATFSGIPLVDRLAQAEDRHCGVWIIHLETGETVGFCRFESGVEEIFAVEVLAGMRFPEVVNHDAELIGRSYVLDERSLQDVPAELRDSAESPPGRLPSHTQNR